MIFNLVFFISLTSVLLQGTTLPQVARWLHVTLPVNIGAAPRSTSPLPMNLSRNSLRSTSRQKSFDRQKILELSFPKKALIVLIKRNGKYLTPGGSTVIQAGDTLIILAENSDALEDVKGKIGV